LNLPFEAVEKIAFEFSDLAATKAGHVDVVALRAAFVKMFLSLHVHEIEFVDQAVALQQSEGAIYGDAVDLGIELAGLAQDLAGIEMLFGGFDDAEDGATLMGHAQAARHQFSLEPSGSFGLRKWHIRLPLVVENQLQL
jgi:hypothetical protein